MKKCLFLSIVAIAAALIFGGCTLRTVEEMYSIPKRSEEYSSLQKAIDAAMGSLNYSAPLSGENQQTVQMADLTGDGVDEYLLFAKDDSQSPLQILVFCQEGDSFRLMSRISSHGSSFDRVEYVPMDGQPGLELVVGSQVSDQVLRSVSVYTFAGGDAQMLLSASYYRFLACDLAGDNRSELMIIHPGEHESDVGYATLYSLRNGAMERSVEVNLSRPVSSIKRIMVSNLHGMVPAVYVASAVGESSIITDVFAVTNGIFTNVSVSNESGTSVKTLRNYYVYADDIDDDGILELPSLITMRPMTPEIGGNRQYLIRWFSMDLEGNEIDKLYTFHNFLGGWHLQLEDEWAEWVTVAQSGSTYAFYIWNEDFSEAVKVFSIHTLTGPDREENAVLDNRFVLHRAEGVVFAVKIEASSAAYGITEDQLINSFHLIRQDWNTGET